MLKYSDWIATLPTQDIEFVTAPGALAAAVGQIADRIFKSGQAQDPAAIDANYVRRFFVG